MPNSQARLEYDDFVAIAPDAVAALRTLGTTVADSGLEKELTELIKVRASQINGCAFCIQYHLNLARQFGVAAEKLDLLAAWREAGVFGEREKAALGWTEALTAIAGRTVSDTDYALVREHFTENEVVFLTIAIAAINQWNRIAIALRFTPPARKRISREMS